MSNEKKEAIGNILTLGTAINNFYDIGLLKVNEYMKLRNIFKTLHPYKENDFRRYRRDLTQLEKHRPVPSVYHEKGKSRLEPMKKYREDVNRLSVAFSFSVAFDKPLSDYYEGNDKLSEEDKSIFEGFYNAVMAMQVVDDIVGREGDLKYDRPSFYTASCTPQEIKTQKVLDENGNTYDNLNRLFSHYCNQSDQYASNKLRPILSAVRFTKIIYPRLTDLAKKYNKLETIGGINLLTWRDKANL